MKGPDVVLFFDSDTDESEVAAIVKKVKKQLQAVQNTRKGKRTPLLLTSEEFTDCGSESKGPAPTSCSDESRNPLVLSHNISEKKRRLNSRLERLLKIKRKKEKLKRACADVSDTAYEEQREIAEVTGTSADTSYSVESSNNIPTFSVYIDSAGTSTSTSKDVNRQAKSTLRKRKNIDDVCCTDRKKLRQAVFDRKDLFSSIYNKSRYVALDCEFVGVGPYKKSALGRCSIVDFDGRILLDIFSQPDEPITDYRTPWSGLRPHHMKHAVPFENAQNQIRRLIEGKVVVGHAVHNDFGVLKISKSRDMIRDTSKHAPLRTLANLPTKGSISLKALSLHILGSKIQINTHCSVEDARATMALYRQVWEQWEEGLAQGACNGTSSDHTNEADIEVESFLDDAYWPNDV